MSVGARMSAGKDDGTTRRSHEAEWEAEREELRRELGRKAFRIAELEEEVRQVAETFESSLSWRITRPVRSARGLLKRLRRS